MAKFRLTQPVRVRDVPAAGKTLHLVADAEDRARIADQLGIVAVDRLEADIQLTQARDEAVRLQATLDSDVVQTCTLTLEPVTETVREDIDVLFLPEPDRNSHDPKTILVDPDDDEDYEYHSNGRIDLGLIITEHLALGLNPYPRKRETEFPGHVEDDTLDRVSPFEGLEQFRDKKS